MRIRKWVDMGAEVDIEVGADDIAAALSEAFSESNQELEEAVNVHDILRAFNSIGGFLNAFKDDQIAALNPMQRETIGKFLTAAAGRFKA